MQHEQRRSNFISIFHPSIHRQVLHRRRRGWVKVILVKKLLRSILRSVESLGVHRKKKSRAHQKNLLSSAKETSRNNLIIKLLRQSVRNVRCWWMEFLGCSFVGRSMENENCCLSSRSHHRCVHLLWNRWKSF